LLLKRYHSLEYIKSLEIEEALSLIEYAQSKREEELLFIRWIPFQVEMGFDEFKTKLKPKPIKKEKEILTDVEKIITLFNTGRGE
jgi:hypothetical protein